MSEAPRLPEPNEIEELLLGGELRYTRLDAVRMTGVSTEFAERLWRAFGYPQPADDAVAFSEGDITALARLRQLMNEGFFDEAALLRMVRAVGQTMARLAEWQVDIMIGEIADGQDPPPPDDIKAILGAVETHIGELEPLIVHAWRRQLAASGARAMTVAAAEDETVPVRARLAVGFADMVSFTQASRDMDEVDLARMVESFEETAADVIAAGGGRLVKTLGDEVLFSAEAPRTGCEIALGLCEAVTSHQGIPDVRVGVAYGPVLPLMGDVFGTTVNLAARLTSIARPGSVLIDAGLAAELDGLAGYQVHRLVRRPARGLGLIQPHVLRRRTAPED
ncbi:MAG TPA: adenylate/guanylate cyclase domain-containing protein [Streptosporangiaceae bacterium]|nr:adenylate/guanylate cyclase domain-containing protein [Streptosporangiaceae bacterium]